MYSDYIRIYKFSVIVLFYFMLEVLYSNQYLITLSIIVILYAVYYSIFRYFTVRMRGNYDTSKKNIGRSLPPYPNGWYIACKSKELLLGKTKQVDISGQNITLFRSLKGDVYALHSYCAHMGANLGIGGQVVNDTCIQCPFHGWLFDGETGQCVDHDGKPVMAKSIEYGQNFADSQCTRVDWKQGAQNSKQRKYIAKEINTFIYVWIHADPSVEPYFMMLNNEQWINKFENRGQTIHDIYSHIQDIPENGADVFHFKYIHRYLIGRYKLFEVSWAPKWKRGDDPDLAQLFEHKDKSIREFKQEIYNKLIKNIPNKQYYSVANVDNYLQVHIIGPVFVFNLTIIQMGPGIVNIYLKSKFFQIVFLQYIQSQDKFHQRLFHEMFASSWLPYWLSSIMLYAEGMQVYYDMLVWDAKRVSYKLFYKDNQADRFIKSWREWFSQNYQGCDVQLKADKGTNDW